jgi:hypothetical protein
MNPLTPFLITGCGLLVSIGLMWLATAQRRHLWLLLLSSLLALTCLVVPHLFSRGIYPLGRLPSDPKSPPSDVIVFMFAGGYIIWTAGLLILRRKLPYESNNNT